jgi:hypothetical protein
VVNKVQTGFDARGVKGIAQKRGENAMVKFGRRQVLAKGHRRRTTVASNFVVHWFVIPLVLIQAEAEAFGRKRESRYGQFGSLRPQRINRMDK